MSCVVIDSLLICSFCLRAVPCVELQCSFSELVHRLLSDLQVVMGRLFVSVYVIVYVSLVGVFFLHETSLIVSIHKCFHARGFDPWGPHSVCQVQCLKVTLTICVVYQNYSSTLSPSPSALICGLIRLPRSASKTLVVDCARE